MRSAISVSYTHLDVYKRQTRYRTETDTWTDADGNTHTETYRVPYDYYICNEMCIRDRGYSGCYQSLLEGGSASNRACVLNIFLFISVIVLNWWQKYK